MIHQSSQPELSSAKNWINRNENSMVPSRCCLMSTLLNRYSANLKGRFLFTNLAIDSNEIQQTAARVRIEWSKQEPPLKQEDLAHSSISTTTYKTTSLINTLMDTGPRHF